MEESNEVETRKENDDDVDELKENLENEENVGNGNDSNCESDSKADQATASVQPEKIAAELLRQKNFASHCPYYPYPSAAGYCPGFPPPALGSNYPFQTLAVSNKSNYVDNAHAEDPVPDPRRNRVANYCEATLSSIVSIIVQNVFLLRACKPGGAGTIEI